MFRAVRFTIPIGLLFYTLANTACSSGGNEATGVDVFGNGGSSGGGGISGTGNGPSFGATTGTTTTYDPTKCNNDGKVGEGEQCDDNNRVANDGCTPQCKTEAGWICAPKGGGCVAGICGDGILTSAETCDDGNTVDGDGCSKDCLVVTEGWQCRVQGKPCRPLCGDGKITDVEKCDDGNAISGDGCSSTCLTEPGWSCATTPCVKSICGNGTKEEGESCDLGPENGRFYGDGKGCSKTCTMEPVCRDAKGTTACITRCGDGNLDPGEACDDGNAFDGDGCTKDCLGEDGFTCTPADNPDDEDCTPPATGKCLKLPITFRDFDGQQATGGHPDFFYMGAGGTVCVPNASGKKDTTSTGCWTSDSTDLCLGLVNPTLDANGKPTLNTTRTGGSTCGCRFTDWDGTGVITRTTAGGTVSTCTSGASTPTRIDMAGVQVIKSKDSFTQWYSDSTTSTKVTDVIELAQLAGTNQYQFSSSNGLTVVDDLHDIWLNTGKVAPAGAATELSSGFFPLEKQPRTKLCNLWPYWKTGADAALCVAKTGGTTWTQQWDVTGWAGGPTGAKPAIPDPDGEAVTPVRGVMRNFYFTSEVRYLFRYVGGETLSFYGDDDVWVFVNGKLVLDLGAPHERLQGSVTIDPAAGGTAKWTVGPAATPLKTGTVPSLGMDVGKTYEIAVFHADRHPRESNYQLTLSGFSTKKSICEPTCGDGVIATGEECDNGAENNDDLYNGCTTDCKFGPFCGDGNVNGDEKCDSGKENGPAYASAATGGCSAKCELQHYCGDGEVDILFGETCDEGKDTVLCQKCRQVAQ